MEGEGERLWTGLGLGFAEEFSKLIGKGAWLSVDLAYFICVLARCDYRIQKTREKVSVKRKEKRRRWRNFSSGKNGLH